MDLVAHLQGRDLDMNLHRVWLDTDAVVATFPLWTLAGVMCGYMSYRPLEDKEKRNDEEKGRYYKFVTFHENPPRKKLPLTVPVWGLESWHLSRTLFVLEGIFDATRLTKRGYSAIAVLTNNARNKSLKRFLHVVKAGRRVVSVTDPDEGGQMLANVGHETVSVECGTDLGAAPDFYVDNLVKHYA